MPDLLLLSNSTSPGMGFLEHARRAISELIPRPGSHLLFVPFAGFDYDQYTQVMTDALAPLSVRVTGAHQVSDPAAALGGCDAVFVGGGNSFRLLRALEDTGLTTAIPRQVREGLPYLGSSAGTNMACPTLRTTNDMPIVQPASFDALGLIPFQVNPHYLDADPASTHQGETRAERIAQFLECNAVPVLGLREGSWLRVSGPRASLGGTTAARLFTRGEPDGTELAPGTDVSELLSTVPRFDTPRRPARRR
jgi:dipeptidase E